MASIFVCESLSAGAAGAGAVDGDLLAAGVAMRNAIVDDLLRIDDAAVTCAVGPGPGCAAPWHGPGTRRASVSARPGEAIHDFVGRMAALHDLCWIVAPETGGELARLHTAVGARRWIGCDAAAIACAASKRATLAALAAAGVPTPLDGAHRHRGRWVVKPDDGAGCLSTRRVADRAAAARCLHDDATTVQPWVEGDALSVSMIAGAGGAEAVSFNRQRIAIDADGRLADRGVEAAALDPGTDPRVPGLRAIAAATARALPGLRGFVGVDVVWNAARGPVVIEVNPRVTCAYVGLSERLGRNLARDVLRLKLMERHHALPA